MKRNNNGIIHITNKMDNLMSIISSNSLKLSFCCENFAFKGKVVSRAAHPMICFSEYNLDEINNKIITYGKYGIGFSKAWARENSIGPVLYVSESSTAARGMSKLLKERRIKEDGNRLSSKIKLAIMEVKCFMKNEEGYNSYNKLKNFDFKSENEWRYVPQKKEIKDYLISQNKTTYLKNKDKHNKKLENFPLNFKLSDLKVVYVSSEFEKNQIIQMNNINPSIVKISNWKT